MKRSKLFPALTAIAVGVLSLGLVGCGENNNYNTIVFPGPVATPTPTPAPTPSTSPTPGARVSDSKIDLFPFGGGCPTGIPNPPNRSIPYPLNRLCTPELTLTPFYDNGQKASPADTGAGDQRDVETYRVALANIQYDVLEGQVVLEQQANLYNLKVSARPGATAGPVRIRARLTLPKHQQDHPDRPRVVEAEWRADLT